MLAEKLRALGKDERVQGKGKGREVLLRYEGEVIEGEHPAVVRDPRKESKVKRAVCLRPGRSELLPLKYEHDENAMGPPPPTAILVLNLSPLTPNSYIRRCFSAHGTITSFEPQIDKATGGALGIVFIRYSTHEEARKCAERENGKKLSTGAGVVNGNEEMAVVLDGEGKVLKAVLKQLDERKRRENEEKRRKEREGKMKDMGGSNSARGTPSAPSSHTPARGASAWKANQHAGPLRVQHKHYQDQRHGGWPPPSANLPPPPNGRQYSGGSPMPPGAHLNGVANGPKGAPPPKPRKAASAFTRARPNAISLISSFPPQPSAHSSTSPVRSRGRHWPSLPDERDEASPSMQGPSRSPSPVTRKPGYSARDAHRKEHEQVMEELAQNGFDHVTIDGHGSQLGGAFREEDVRQFFDGFKIDKVLRDNLGWYVTFKTGDSARRAAMVLNSGARTLAHRSVNVTVRPSPTTTVPPTKARWNDDELIEQAEKIILKELRASLEKDVMDRLVGSDIKRLVAEEKAKRGTSGTTANGQVVEGGFDVADRAYSTAGLRGLSFRKQKKRPLEETQVTLPLAVAVEDNADEPLPEPPRKKQRKVVKEPESDLELESEDEDVAAPQAVINEDIESEDEPEPAPAPVVSVLETISPQKRATSEMSDLEEPPSKKSRIQPDEAVAPAVPLLTSQKKKPKKSSKKKPPRPTKPAQTEEVVHEVLADDFDFDIPAVTQVRLTPTPHYDSSLSPPSSPVREAKPITPTLDDSQPVDPIAEGICDDDEDIYFAKLALSRSLFGKDPPEAIPRAPTPDPDALPPFRVHVTGSARTEGYYKISHAEKSAYVAQYASRGTVNEATPEVDPPQQNITSSRSNRANARRRAQGLEEINQVQRAMALSKGESAATELVKFNQLQTRKKHLRFARSPIHDWGLYAMEKISRGEMVIEYVGEIIRAQVADKREKAYERQGIGSSYLFRIDEDLVVDATKKGNLGRLINHSCDPNCTAKIITINGEKKIVIYAKQDIELGSEITYDYHFPIEQDKIPCLCGSAKCRGFLN